MKTDNERKKIVTKAGTGFATGYVGVPPGHPWYRKDYKDIHIESEPYGGLTFSGYRDGSEAYWWVGYDALHYGSTSAHRTQAFCEQQMEIILKGAILAL